MTLKTLLAWLWKLLPLLIGGGALVTMRATGSTTYGFDGTFVDDPALGEIVGTLLAGLVTFVLQQTGLPMPSLGLTAADRTLLMDVSERVKRIEEYTKPKDVGP